MKKITVILLTILVSLTAAAGASAHERYYVPKPHAKCRVDYRRETVRVRRREHHRWVRVRQVRCVFKAAVKKPVAAPVGSPTSTPVTAPAISYKAGVDPSFTQSPTDPLAVTYAYSASATETVNGAMVDLAAEGQLPSGVLNFYSATSPGGTVGLECSMDVGGATAGGSCPVTYSQTGTYNVTTEYVPNAASAVTETDQETIAPFTSSASVSVAYGTPYSETGPPPINQQYNDVADGISIASSDPSNEGFAVTLVDQTSGAEATGTVVPGDQCDLQFWQDAGAATFGLDPSCGLPGMNFTDGDQMRVSVTTSGSNGWLPASPTAVTITAPW